LLARGIPCAFSVSFRAFAFAFVRRPNPLLTAYSSLGSCSGG
jgi:hypothetical protein